MKLVRMLDDRETLIVLDAKNQVILRELVWSEYPVSELARKVRIPEVTLWKHMQILFKAGLVEVSRVKRAGNLEKKYYRATAANYVPSQFMRFRPKDPRLLDAFEVSSQIQQMSLALQARNFEIPEGVDPVDYAYYKSLWTFVQVNKDPAYRQRVAELEEKLSKYKAGAGGPD